MASYRLGPCLTSDGEAGRSCLELPRHATAAEKSQEPARWVCHPERERALLLISESRLGAIPVVSAQVDARAALSYTAFDVRLVWRFLLPFFPKNFPKRLSAA